MTSILAQSALYRNNSLIRWLNSMQLWYTLLLILAFVCKDFCYFVNVHLEKIFSHLLFLLPKTKNSPPLPLSPPLSPPYLFPPFSLISISLASLASLPCEFGDFTSVTILTGLNSGTPRSINYARYN